MSTYTVTTNFTLKDSLPSGDPAKIIKGVDFGTEFANIATAINDNASDLVTLETKVDTKASIASLDALETTVNTKASIASVDALETTVNTKASIASVDALETTVNTKVNASSPSTSGTFTHTGNAVVTGSTDLQGAVTLGSSSSDLIDLDGKLIVNGGISTLDADVELGTSVKPFRMDTNSGDSYRLITHNPVGDDIRGMGTGNNGVFLTVGIGDTGIGFRAGSFDAIMPYNFETNATRNDAIDIGASGAYFDNIYATNGVIQTSDANRKSNIRELTEAERNVAVACKSLMRAFQLNMAIEKKGEDEARIHFGIIAQDLKAAFEAEGLDAGRYGVFIEGTYEDEETGEEKTRLGVRYIELLAFIIAAI